MPPPNSLRQLRLSDKSSPDFHDKLRDILHGEEYKQWVLNIDGEDLVWLVDCLDKVLSSLDPTSTGFSTCLRELIHVCDAKKILPTSCTHPSSLIGIGRHPVPSRGSRGSYEGVLSGSQVRVKRLRVHSKDGSSEAIRALYRAVVAWKYLKHPNIVPFLGITSTPLQLISEWMPGGVLTEYIKGHPDTDRLSLLSDTTKGLCFLHSRNIVHGDLKGPNILVDAVGRARITDFGLTVFTQNQDSIKSVSNDQDQTVRWIAPEILNGQGAYSKEADVFSLAMVMIEVFTSTVPFNNSGPAAAAKAIVNGKRPLRPLHPVLTSQLWTLVQRCWAQDPRLRPEASEVLKDLPAPDLPTWKRLISDPLSTDEYTSLTTSIFSKHNEINVVEYLSGDDAQIFIDVIYKVLESLAPKIRKRCVCSLSRICGRQALLPKALEMPLCHDPMELPLCHGGFTDVWKSQYCGQDVASKVLRVYQTNDFNQIRKRFCKGAMTWKGLRHPNVLPLLGVTMTETRFVMVSEWMTKGNINEFIKADDHANRLELLVEVTKGLIYMHEQGIVHGDLRGANVLIDRNGHARLAGFGLPTIISDWQSFLFSCIESGTAQWMSPELLDPDSFGLKKIRPTKPSDCYALGMVIYEVLTGLTPFAPFRPPVVIRKVLDGERPRRPQGEEGSPFTDNVWRVTELCWQAQPDDRRSAKVVLLGLEGDPSALRLSSDMEEGEETDAGYQSDTTANESTGPEIINDENTLLGSPHGYRQTSVPDTPTAHGEKELMASLFDHRPSASRSKNSLDGGQILDPRQSGDSKEGRVGRSVRNPWKMFRAVTRELCGL